MFERKCFDFKYIDVLTRHSGSKSARSSRTALIEKHWKITNIASRDTKTNRKARIKVTTNQNERKCIKIMSLFT
jgi:hypothetical protein